VSAVFAGRTGNTEVEDLGSVFMQCADGHSIFVDVSWRHVGPHEKLAVEVVGATGSAAIAPLAVFKEMHGAPVNVTPLVDEAHGDPFSSSYRAEWEHFLHVARGESPAPTLGDQLLLHRVMEAIQDSARSGREVIL
jgi:predicted dehydrogenase